MTDHRTPDGTEHGPPPVDGSLTLTVRSDNCGDLLILAGELDLASAPLVLEAAQLVRQMASQHVVVDVSGLQFLDATGLSALLQAREELLGDGLAMSLRGIPACVHRVLDITGLADTFVLEPVAQADGA